MCVCLLVGQAPLVAREGSARLEHPEDLAVDAVAVGRVARRLDRKDRVEGVVGEWELLELKTLSREKLTRRGCIVRASTV